MNCTGSITYQMVGQTRLQVHTSCNKLLWCDSMYFTRNLTNNAMLISFQLCRDWLLSAIVINSSYAETDCCQQLQLIPVMPKETVNNCTFQLDNILSCSNSHNLHILDQSAIQQTVCRKSHSHTWDYATEHAQFTWINHCTAVLVTRKIWTFFVFVFIRGELQ